jgi:XTP/dITP diphosphohydrolase
MKIVFATNNAHKLVEIRNALSTAALNRFEVIGLQEMGIDEIIPETQNTLEGNAIQKARYIQNKYSISCFADDTGLEVEALNNRPGVYSARYAGEECSYDDNVNKLLKEMGTIQMRNARFCTIIAFNYKGKISTFEGVIDGTITKEQRGIGGFGYDSVFQPNGFEKTFAEMTLDEKNTISHRALALKKFIEFLSADREYEKFG